MHLSFFCHVLFVCFLTKVSFLWKQRDRVHYLLETGYPALPVIPTPLIRPPETQDLNDDLAYEDMEGVLRKHGLVITSILKHFFISRCNAFVTGIQLGATK